MPLQGHWERQNTPLRSIGRRERRIFVVVAATLLLAAAIAVFAGLSNGEPKTARGCVNITIVSTTGGAKIHACGANAARVCRFQAAHDDAAARAAQAVCRKAGYG